MRIAYITAGAAGMFCGSCLHDNTLVTALRALGHDALLIPTYTPIRTDEPDVSQKRVFFGGINVYLQQKTALFRHTPWFVDRLLDAPGLLRWASRFAVKTRAEQLGELTISILKGEHGHQRKELAKLVHWLKREERPDVVNLTNVLLSGIVPELKEQLRVPMLATLQGDDVFLEALPDTYRRQALDLIRAHCRVMDGFIATSRYYADFMAGYLDIPRERIHVVYPGLNLKAHENPSGGRQPPERDVNDPSGGLRPPLRKGDSLAIGYLARICPEKGLHQLVDAFRVLQQTADARPCRLRVSGWLGQDQQSYFDELRGRLREWGLERHFEYVESPDLGSKIRFLQSIDILSVPTTYREPKGLYILEALAHGVPVVQPRHGSFPELIEATGGGLLVNPDDPADLARGLLQLLTDAKLRLELGRMGQEAIQQRFTAQRMAQDTMDVYRRHVLG